MDMWRPISLRKFLRWWFLSILLIAGMMAQDQGLTPEMVVNLKQAFQVAIDPAGQKIAYVVAVPREESDEPGGSYTEIWVVPFRGGEPRQYTAKPVNAWAVSWSPDGKLLTFLSYQEQFDPHTQVYGLPVDGGAPRLLTHHENGVSQYRWSPDGRWIAFISRDPQTEEEKKARKTGEDWIVYDTDYKFPRLYVVNVETGEEHRVFEEDLAVWEVEWAPDSKTLVFQATEKPLTDDSYMFKKIYTVPAEGGKPTVLCPTEGKLGDMAYSPDGRQFAFIGATSLNDPLAQSLFVVPANGGTPQNLTRGFKGSAHSLFWLDNRTILLLSTEGTQNTLRKVDVRTGKSKVVYNATPIIQSISVHRKSGRFAAAVHGHAHPLEVYAGSVKSGKITRLTHLNPELEKVRLARQEVIRWKGADGWTIEGVLTYPLDYQEGKKYPLILQIHGGPEGVSLNGWTTRSTYPVQVLAANGYMVLQPNYRGSGGYGVEFSKADHDDLGGKEYEDVLAGIDYLIQKGLVDGERVGTGGWSYGGYFSAWGATRHSDRFKASVVAAGLTNWISFTGTTDIPYEMSLVHWNSWWYDRRDLHWERSPLYHIKNAKTPTLIVHGLKDERVHPEQSLELYQSLKHNHVPTRLIMYPREPHGLRERAHKLHFMRNVLEWYDRYVKKAEPATQEKYIN